MPPRRPRTSPEKTKPLPRVIDTPSMMQALSMAHRQNGATIGFVPTMGALHSGHEVLIREARLRGDVVVVSIFVNPLQFNDPKDLKKYPRPFDDDLTICGELGVDLVFAPEAASFYPPDFETTVNAGPLGRRLEGRVRPGHFDGMLTVVLKLFQAVDPHFAVFGEKDFQQLQIVKRMVRDFHHHVEIVPMPVIRDVDGLALSSRNVRIAAGDRRHALALYRALQMGQDHAASGETRASVIVRAAKQILDDTPKIAIDYVACVNPRTLLPVTTIESGTRLVLAASVGARGKAVRLIDNGPLFPGIGTPAMPQRLPVGRGAKKKAKRKKAA